MTNQKMPDEIYATEVNGGYGSREFIAIEGGTKISEYRTSYTLTDLCTAALAERDALRALCEGMAGAAKEGETIIPLLIGDLVYMADRMNEGARFKEMTASAQGILDRVQQSLAAYETHKGVG